MKKFFKLQIFLLAFLIAAAGVFPAAAQSDDTNIFAREIINYNLSETSSADIQQWIDGDLTENAGNGSEWYVLALANYGSYDFSKYKKSLKKYLSENEIGAAASRQKTALVFLATGEEKDEYITSVLENSIGEQGIMSLIFGLHLLNNGCKSSKYSTDKLIEELLSLQTDDAGWSLTGGYGDVDVTAMTVQALAPHYSGKESVKSAIDKALDFLSQKQLENGGFSSYGTNNPESAAQVIIALSSLNIDFQTDSRFIKGGNTISDGIKIFRLENGGFCHKEGTQTDSTATVQVFCACVAYENMKKGKSSFYDFSNNDVQEPETESTQAKTEKMTEAESKTEQETVTSNSRPSLAETTANETTLFLTDNTPETTNQDPKSDKETISASFDLNYKFWVVSAIAALTAVLIIVFLVRKKRSKKDFILILLVAIAATTFVLFTNFESTQSHYDSAFSEKDALGSVTLSISCETLANEKSNYIPNDGIILEETTFEFEAEDTVYDVLTQACKKNKIQIEINGSSGSVYVEGINNIYEMDFGDLSGWMYCVNGDFPSVGCGEYKVHSGDSIKWIYTREMGKDLDAYID